MLVGLQLSLLLTSAKVSFLSLPFSGNSGLSLPTSGASFFTSTSGRPKESNRLVFARVCMTGRIRPADSQSFLSPLLPRVCLSVRPLWEEGEAMGPSFSSSSSSSSSFRPCLFTESHHCITRLRRPLSLCLCGFSFLPSPLSPGTLLFLCFLVAPHVDSHMFTYCDLLYSEFAPQFIQVLLYPPIIMVNQVPTYVAQPDFSSASSSS